MRRSRFLALPVLLAMSACATHQPRITAAKGQGATLQAADVTYCDEQVPEAGRNVGALSIGLGLLTLPVGGWGALLGYYGAKKQQERYATCLRQRGYQVVEE